MGIKDMNTNENEWAGDSWVKNETGYNKPGYWIGDTWVGNETGYNEPGYWIGDTWVVDYELGDYLKTD